jgi:hypothetical protein
VNGEDLIARPEDVRLYYADGTSATVEVLYYDGQDDDGMHVWEALDPYPETPITHLHVGTLPAHTTIKVRR